jgi:hypothetical protein
MLHGAIFERCKIAKYESSLHSADVSSSPQHIENSSLILLINISQK